MTINQAIYAVLEGTGIASTDDMPFSKQWVYNEILNARNELIKQELNKRRLLESDAAQSLECVTLERVDAAGCLDCDSGLYILKSKQPLPKPLQSDWGVAIVGVFLMNGVAVDKLSKTEWRRRKKRRYQLPNSFGYFISNEYLYIADYDNVDELVVNVDGHFESPEQISRLNHRNACENEPDKGACLPIYELEFESPGHILRRAIEIAKASIFAALRIPRDTNNNTQFDLNAQSKT